MRVLGLVVALAYGAAIGWVYARQPRTVAQLAGGMASTVGAYRIDQAAFGQGLGFFRGDKFEEARLAWERADPARQDPTTQFYVAYSYYRQGWGRLYQDDALYRKGLETVDRARRLGGGRVAVSDPDLGLPTSDELRAELVRGLTRDASDLNPLHVLERRK